MYHVGTLDLVLTHVRIQHHLKIWNLDIYLVLNYWSLIDIRSKRVNYSVICSMLDNL
jgi:hypothetical protein